MLLLVGLLVGMVLGGLVLGNLWMLGVRVGLGL
jgi:hypothetical protein